MLLVVVAAVVVRNIQKIANIWKTSQLLYAHYLTTTRTWYDACVADQAGIFGGSYATWARSPYKVIIIIMIMIIYLTWPASILSRQVNIINLKSTLIQVFSHPAKLCCDVCWALVEVMRCQSKFQLKIFPNWQTTCLWKTILISDMVINIITFSTELHLYHWYVLSWNDICTFHLTRIECQIISISYDFNI